MANFIGEIIGYGIGTILRNKKATRIILTVIIIYNLMGLVSHAFQYSVITTVVLLVPSIIVVGITERVRTLPLRLLQNRYKEMFEQMKFKSTGGAFPLYLGEQEVGSLLVLGFQSKIPLEEWINKKSLLETYLNTKISKICNSPDDNNIVQVYTITSKLPEELSWDSAYLFPYDDVLTLGATYENIAYIELIKTPHAFIAGETGSGKSNILKCLIYQCLMKGHDVVLIDFKRGVSFSAFEMFVTVFSDYDETLTELDALIQETNRRLDLLRESKVEDIEQYNKKYSNKIKRVVVFIDELAELMRAGEKKANKDILYSLETLTRTSRAAGINLIMGIQRPDATIINGQIKNNVSLRICGRFVDPEPSRIMLGNESATQLPQIRGRFILRDDEMKEFQAFYFKDVDMSDLRPRVTETKAITEERPVEKDTSRLDFNFDDISI